MPSPITDADRRALLRAAVAGTGRDVIVSALTGADVATLRTSTVARNSLQALRRHRDPAAVLARPQYRAAVPLLAAVIADPCLEACIEQLGDHAEEPTRDQLLEVLDELCTRFGVPVAAVMLASVSEGSMPASDLCFDILATDDRYGLREVAAGTPGTGPDAPAPESRPGTGADREPPPTTADGPDTAVVERREERRRRRRQDADERRRRAEASKRTAEQTRQARRRRPVSAGDAAPRATAPATGAPRLRRRAALTPAQEAEFDRDDPLAGAVVFAWIPYEEDGDDAVVGKSRPCVVVAASPDALLVRPGYSVGGSKSRDWKAVEVRGWRRAGFEQPTSIDAVAVRIPREAGLQPVGRLAEEDWNALW